MGLGKSEILIIILLIVLLFNLGKIPKLFREVGEGIRSFKDGLKGDDKSAAKDEQPKA